MQIRSRSRRRRGINGIIDVRLVGKTHEHIANLRSLRQPRQRARLERSLASPHRRSHIKPIQDTEIIGKFVVGLENKVPCTLSALPVLQ